MARPRNVTIVGWLLVIDGTWGLVSMLAPLFTHRPFHFSFGWWGLVVGIDLLRMGLNSVRSAHFCLVVAGIYYALFAGEVAFSAATAASTASFGTPAGLTFKWVIVSIIASLSAAYLVAAWMLARLSASPPSQHA